MANESLLANVDLSSIPDAPKPQSLLAGVDLSAFADAPKAPEPAPSDQIPMEGVSEANQNYTGILPKFTPPAAPQNLWRENAPQIQQEVWDTAEGQPPAVGPVRAHPLGPDVQYATGLVENLAVGLDNVFSHLTANLASIVGTLPLLPEEQGLMPTLSTKPSPNLRADIYNAVFTTMQKAMKVDRVAPPQDFADALIRGGAEGAGSLVETYALGMLTGGVLNPLTEGIAAKVPYLFSVLYPVARDAITFGAQSALEPGATIGSTGVGAGAGAALGFLGPCGRIARALGAASIGLAREYMSNPNAGPMDYARNAALMGTFAAIGAAHGMTPDEAAAYTILDWAKDKGYSEDALARALKIQGIGPLANEFAEDVTRQGRPGEIPAAQPLVDQLAAKFKPVSPEEFITERDKSTKRPFLTPYTAEDMKGWQHFLTDDGVGFALTPDKDIVGVINNSGKKGAGEEAVTLAIAKGGKTLDCVEGFLDGYYNSFGFVEKSRVPWDDNKAPKGWDYEIYKRRDIVFFEFPEDFSRDPADTARRLEIARAEGGPGFPGSEHLWTHDEWVEAIDRATRERMGGGTQGGPGQGTGNHSAELTQPSEPAQEKPSSEKQSKVEEQPEPDNKIIQFRNVGPDTTQSVQELTNNLLVS